MTPRPRILVTGAGGFLGRQAVRALVDRGLCVRCLVRTPESARGLLDALPPAFEGRLEMIISALRSDCVDPWVVDGCDIVIHAAGALRGSVSSLVRQNVATTRRLLEAARAASVRRFVLVSSLTVYAANQLPEGGTLDETCPIDPAPERRSAYAYSKIAQEDVCRVEGSGRGVPVVIVRPGVIYGPGRSCLSDRVGPRLGRWTAVVDAGRPLPYTFLSNCAEAVALSAIARGIDDTALNVVDDELPTGRDIVDTCRLAGETIRAVALSSGTARAFARAYEWYYQLSDGMVPPGFLPARVGPLFKSLRYSNARAKAALGWTPRVGLRTALALTAGQRAA